MNRAERRKQGIKQPPAKMKHMTEFEYANQLNKAYQEGVADGYKRASNYAVVFMMCVPLIVLREKFGEIRLKDVDGESREERFFNLCLERYEDYNNGEDTLDRLLSDVKEITGVDVSKKVIDDG